MRASAFSASRKGGPPSSAASAWAWTIAYASSRAMPAWVMADLERDALQRAAGDRERAQQRGMPVALDDLGRHRLRLEPEAGERVGLGRGIEVRERPDRARELADRAARERGLQAIEVAPE